MYASPFHRLTFSGILGPKTAPVETWACTLSLRHSSTGPVVDTVANLQTAVASMAPLLGTFFGPSVTNTCHMNNVRLSLVGTDGRTVRTPEGAYAHAYQSIDSTGTGTFVSPFQVAQVHTLQSVAVGSTGRGRFYLPCPALGLDATGRFDTTAMGAQANRFAALIDGLSTTHGDQVWRVVVASQGSVLKGIAPAHRVVTQLRLGRVPDVMSSRRRSIDESYVEKVVTPVGTWAA